MRQKGEVILENEKMKKSRDRLIFKVEKSSGKKPNRCKKTDVTGDPGRKRKKKDAQVPRRLVPERDSKFFRKGGELQISANRYSHRTREKGMPAWYQRRPQSKKIADLQSWHRRRHRASSRGGEKEERLSTDFHAKTRRSSISCAGMPKGQNDLLPHRCGKSGKNGVIG